MRQRTGTSSVDKCVLNVTTSIAVRPRACCLLVSSPTRRGTASRAGGPIDPNADVMLTLLNALLSAYNRINIGTAGLASGPNTFRAVMALRRRCCTERGTGRTFLRDLGDCA